MLPYREAWDSQKRLVEARSKDEISDLLIFCQHTPVVTLGRGLKRGNVPVVLKSGVEIFEVERGGLATYHGPGQIVAYPIFQLGRTQKNTAKRGVIDLIHALEKWVIDALKSQGLSASRVEGRTGVWVGDEARKIASIGIAARHWVSYHGIALNYATGTEVWQGFDPCGFGSQVMTDLSLETGRDFTYDQLKEILSRRADHFLNGEACENEALGLPYP